MNTSLWEISPPTWSGFAVVSLASVGRCIVVEYIWHATHRPRHRRGNGRR